MLERVEAKSATCERPTGENGSLKREEHMQAKARREHEECAAVQWCSGAAVRTELVFGVCPGRPGSGERIAAAR